MAEVLEDGDIYFLYRPRVEDEHVESLDEVQRLLVVLHPWRGRQRFRLLVVPPARPAAEGAYVIARHDDHTHLAYTARTAASPRSAAA